MKEKFNVIGFEFAALNFINSSENQYKYKLEGFDEEWVSAGKRNEVTYSNLKPGRYTFKVIASNSDGIWNEDGKSLYIKDSAPFLEI
ncbi:MAG: hypothetical protein HC905_32130 [Bacteroidales bacterium]|nr:hypothetical protein [Bacteroidales bacterium]